MPFHRTRHVPFPQFLRDHQQLQMFLTNRILASNSYRQNTKPTGADRARLKNCSTRLSMRDLAFALTFPGLRCASSTTSLPSRQFGQIEKNDVRRISDGNIFASEFQMPALLIHFEYRNVVCSLISAIQEISSGIKAETTWIVASSPLISHMLQ